MLSTKLALGWASFVDGKPYHVEWRPGGRTGTHHHRPQRRRYLHLRQERLPGSNNLTPQRCPAVSGEKGGLPEPQGADTTILDVFDAARRGDEIALSVLNRVVTYLGLALSFTVNVLNPEMIILGGDIPLGQDLLVSRLKEVIVRNVPEPYQRSLKVLVSPLGLDIGLKGAASSCFPPNPIRIGVIAEVVCPPRQPRCILPPASN